MHWKFFYENDMIKGKRRLRFQYKLETQSFLCSSKMFLTTALLIPLNTLWQKLKNDIILCAIERKNWEALVWSQKHLSLKN